MIFPDDSALNTIVDETIFDDQVGGVAPVFVDKGPAHTSGPGNAEYVPVDDIDPSTLPAPDFELGDSGDDFIFNSAADVLTSGDIVDHAKADLFLVVDAASPEMGVMITDYDPANDMIEVVYTDTTGTPPALSIDAVGQGADVQILLDKVVVATITGGLGMTTADVVMTAEI